MRAISLCREAMFVSFEYFPGCVIFLFAFLYKIINSRSLFWRRIQGEYLVISTAIQSKFNFHWHSFGESICPAAGVSLLCSFFNINDE